MKNSISILCAALILVSCNGKDDRIVSETPVDSSMMGVLLCNTYSSEQSLSDTFQRTTGAAMTSSSSYDGGVRTVSLFPDEEVFIFGGYPWLYANVLLDRHDAACAISLFNGYDSKGEARKAFNGIQDFLSGKFGEANKSSEKGLETRMWTDNTNSVGVRLYKWDAGNGSEKWICEMYEVNVNLYNALSGN